MTPDIDQRLQKLPELELGVRNIEDLDLNWSEICVG
jgi:hypothetical protein